MTPGSPAQVGASPTTPAERLLGDRYRLGARVGVGGMATILRAWDTTLERDVAVKIIHAHLADDPAIVARFRTEARHAARLSHPNIVGIYDQGIAELPYIVMELIDGPSLREVLIERGRLAPAEALAVVVPVAAALDRAHAAGVIHRDIKPENVLVSGAGIPKVADFGIARVVAATNHTATGTLVGSVHYMAPELVDGHDASPASDQYALGVVLYELLTGRKPLPADTPMAVALRHAREPIPPPRQTVPDLPRDIDEVVRRATAHDPNERYASCTAMAAALQAAVPGGSAPIEVTRDDGRVHTLVMPLERQDTAAMANAAALDARRVRPAQRHVRRQRRRDVGQQARRVLTGLLIGVLVLAALGAGGFVLWDRVIAPVELVPNLVGVTREEAIAALADRGLSTRIGADEHSLEVPAGAVLRQDPAEDARLRRGSYVELVMSAGPLVVAMPHVAGQQQAEALARLEQHFLTPIVTDEHHDTAPAGMVIGQLPLPDEPVPQGAEVAISVSIGIEQVEVPSLDGLTTEEALAALEEAQLQGEIVEEYSDEQPEPGMVITQSVAGGEQIDKFSTVEVTVSRGPVTIELPSVLGWNVDDAVAELEALELRVDVVYDEVPSAFGIPFGNPGLVEDQDPDPGERVARESLVTLFSYRAGDGDGDGEGNGNGNGNGRGNDDD